MLFLLYPLPSFQFSGLVFVLFWVFFFPFTRFQAYCLEILTKASRIYSHDCKDEVVSKGWPELSTLHCECDTTDKALKGIETLIYSPVKREQSRHLYRGLFSVSKKSSGEKAKRPHAVLFILSYQTTSKRERGVCQSMPKGVTAKKESAKFKKKKKKNDSYLIWMGECLFKCQASRARIVSLYKLTL